MRTIHTVSTYHTYIILSSELRGDGLVCVAGPLQHLDEEAQAK